MVQRKAAVVGLGYVGIPLATLLAEDGHDVVGIDSVAERADSVGRGELPLKGVEPELPGMLARAVASGALRTTTSFEACSDREVVFVCVDTPLGMDRSPDVGGLTKAVIDIGRNMREGALVVVESTVAPGTTLDVLVPAIEKASGLKLGEGFRMAHCPERVMPGRLLYNLRTYDRVIGASDEGTAETVKDIYSRLTEGELHVTDLTTAEIVKTAENAYRDVQIAFANEVAIMCEKLGADAFEVRRLVNTCPFRDMHVPGAGVGGHCLPKDPWLLAYGGREAHPVLIPTARTVNDGMPFHVATLVAEALRDVEADQPDAVVTILGASFLPGSGDTRNSPTVPLIECMRSAEELRLHDPYVDELAGIEVEKDLDRALEGADVVILMVAHEEYASLTPERLRRLMRGRAVVDGRDHFDRREMESAGFVYRGIGKGATASPRGRP